MKKSEAEDGEKCRPPVREPGKSIAVTEVL